MVTASRPHDRGTCSLVGVEHPPIQRNIEMTNDEPQNDRDYDVEKDREEHRSTCGDPHARLAAPMTEQPCCATVSLTRLANGRPRSAAGASPGPLEREVRGHSGWNPGVLLSGPNHLWSRVSHMTAEAEHRCLACLAQRQLSIEEPDD